MRFFCSLFCYFESKLRVYRRKSNNFYQYRDKNKIPPSERQYLSCKQKIIYPVLTFSDWQLRTEDCGPIFLSIITYKATAIRLNNSCKSMYCEPTFVVWHIPKFFKYPFNPKIVTNAVRNIAANNSKYRNYLSHFHCCPQ